MWSPDQDQKNADWLKTAWIYDAKNVQEMRKELEEMGVTVKGFKGTMRYKANLEKLPWLKGL
jgi:hypothetical protein